MSVEGFSPSSSTPSHHPVSVWGDGLVARLGISPQNPHGLIPLDGRVKVVFALVLVSLIALAVRYLWSSRFATQPSESLDGSFSPTLSGQIGDDARRIASLFDNLLKNLRDLRGSTGKEFAAKIQEFYSAHQGSETHPAFGLVRSGEQNYNRLLEMQGALFFAKSYQINRDGIISMPGDGNCLFHGLGAALHLLQPEMFKQGLWNDFPFDHLEIRRRVTQWMKENYQTDDELKQKIKGAILEYCPILEKQLADEKSSLEVVGQQPDPSYREKQRWLEILKTVTLDGPENLAAYQTYIDITEKEGSFASSPQIYAFCKLNPNIGIQISRTIRFEGKEGAPDRVIISNDFDLPFNPAAPFQINPVYNVSGDHFDLRINQ